MVMEDPLFIDDFPIEISMLLVPWALFYQRLQLQFPFAEEKLEAYLNKETATGQISATFCGGKSSVKPMTDPTGAVLPKPGIIIRLRGIIPFYSRNVI